MLCVCGANSVLLAVAVMEQAHSINRLFSSDDQELIIRTQISCVNFRNSGKPSVGAVQTTATLAKRKESKNPLKKIMSDWDDEENTGETAGRGFNYFNNYQSVQNNEGDGEENAGDRNSGGYVGGGPFAGELRSEGHERRSGGGRTYGNHNGGNKGAADDGGGSHGNQRARNSGGGGFRGSQGHGGGGRGRGRGGGSERGRYSGEFGGQRQFNNNKGETDESGEPQKPREFYIPPEPTDNEDEIFGSGIISGINFSKYDSIPVRVTGDKAPQPINSFEEAELRDIVYKNVIRSGYKTPTPIQKAGLPVIAYGRDLMACAQTGSGKTAAFLLPIINSLLNENADCSVGRPQALVVSPTRELAIQIFNEARKFAMGTYLNIRIVYGGTSSKHQGESMNRGGSHILIATPGRLLDFVDKGFLSFEETRFVVLDEADRMLDMGFKQSVANIMHHPTMRAADERQTCMFSATFPEEIQRMAGEYLRDYIFIAIGVVGGACSDVTQNVYEVKRMHKRAKLMELLHENADGTIVFVETKRGADFLASLLSETDFPTTSIHGDRLQRQREMALADFKSGAMKVLIATSVAARGLDIKNVQHVVNYDMPTSIDEYVHRIGRTGRMGNNGRATSFFDPDQDSAIAAGLVKILEGAGQEVPEFLKMYSTGSGEDAAGFGNRFGGRDVRKGVPQTNEHFVNVSGPAALEEDEEWD